MSETFTLSAQQRAAVDRAVWRLTAPIDEVAADTAPNGQPDETRLVGPAGSGKTRSLLAILDALDNLRWDTVQMAPTWRAAREMEKATGRTATSCHKRFYSPPKVEESGELTFSNKLNADVEVRWAIMDEASMIGTTLGADSRTWARRGNTDQIAPIHGLPPVRRLIVGDKAQLSPVNDTWGFDLDHAECELTEVWRQALDSPILDFATRWRQGQVPTWRDFERWTPGACECFGTSAAPATSRVAGLAGVDKLVAKVMDAAQDRSAHEDGANEAASAVIICWTNRERDTVNQVWRRRLQLPPAIVGGDRLLSFSNFGGVCNGDLLDVEDATGPFVATYRNLGIKPPKKGGAAALFTGFPAVAVCIDGFPTIAEIVPEKRQLNLPRWADEMTHLVAVGEGPPLPARLEGRTAYHVQREIPLLDVEFGYGITAHKSQGSTFDIVGVINPNGMRDPDEYRRWLYTAATRPRHNLFLMV